jgi:hypothetical protein
LSQTAEQESKLTDSCDKDISKDCREDAMPKSLAPHIAQEMSKVARLIPLIETILCQEQVSPAVASAVLIDLAARVLTKEGNGLDPTTIKAACQLLVDLTKLEVGKNDPLKVQGGKPQ